MKRQIGGHRMRYEVHPPEEVEQEIMSLSTDVTELLEDAKLSLLDFQGEESGAARMFIERGYSDRFSHWLVAEARAREQADVQSSAS
ncbi:MAG TPA: hypothetical protein VGE01_08490 [Fimbriimonas sp.]